MEEKIAVISGTSKGIGKAVAEHFLQNGYFVYGCSRSETTVTLSNYDHCQMDVGDEAAVRAWVKRIKKEKGKIDVLLCNAGYAPADKLVIMTEGSTLRNVLSTNIMGTFLLCREVSKIMMMQKSGRIINVSSMAEGLHLEGTAAYALSKSAVIELTKILAKEMAQFNITCNVIAPSMYKTESVDVLGKDIINSALETLTVKRVLDIEEIINVIMFFCAKESGCITGQVIYFGLVN